MPLIQAQLLSPRTVGVLVAVALAVFGALFASTDWLAGAVVERLDPSRDRKITAASPILAASLAASLSNDHPTSQTIRAIGDRLVAALPGESPHDYRFRVVKNDEVNAYALPGGAVFVHTGLLQLTDDPDMIAAVLAHEIIHVENRHGVKKLVAGMGKMALFQMVFGVFTDSTAELGAALAILKYGRDMETEADLLGARLMESAGLPRAAMVSMLKKLAEHGGHGPEWLSDHPESGRRARRVADQGH